MVKINIFKIAMAGGGKGRGRKVKSQYWVMRANTLGKTATLFLPRRETTPVIL